MVVDTSPIGDQAPPEFAAIITSPIKIIRSFLSLMSFRSNVTITMVVVRLSSIAERKNVRNPIIHISFLLFTVVIVFVMTSNPSCASISSTIVMAPIRKNKIPDISPRCSVNCSEIITASFDERIKKVQQSTPVSKATAALLTFTLCSKAMRM